MHKAFYMQIIFNVKIKLKLKKLAILTVKQLLRHQSTNTTFSDDQSIDTVCKVSKHINQSHSIIKLVEAYKILFVRLPDSNNSRPSFRHYTCPDTGVGKEYGPPL